MRHFWSVKRSVTVDQCPECNGFFLDEEARHAAADAYFKAVGDPLLDEQRHESQEALERAQRFARTFRFLCPSAYIPGKQAGAAF